MSFDPESAKHPGREGEREAHDACVVVAPDELDEEPRPPLEGIPAGLADVLLEVSTSGGKPIVP